MPLAHAGMSGHSDYRAVECFSFVNTVQSPDDPVLAMVAATWNLNVVFKWCIGFSVSDGWPGKLESSGWMDPLTVVSETGLELFLSACGEFVFYFEVFAKPLPQLTTLWSSSSFFFFVIPLCLFSKHPHCAACSESMQNESHHSRGYIKKPCAYVLVCTHVRARVHESQSMLSSGCKAI